jgi:hypothetical protein
MCYIPKISAPDTPSYQSNKQTVNSQLLYAVTISAHIVATRSCESSTQKSKHPFYINKHLFGKLGGRNTDAIGVTVEEHTLALSLGSLSGLNPVADTRTVPHSLEEASPSGVGLSAVVVTHDLLDGLASLVGIVEGDSADVVVENMGLNDAVEDVTTDETEITVNSGTGSTDEVPRLGLVVRESRVGVLEVSDGNCWQLLVLVSSFQFFFGSTYPASDSPRDKEFHTILGG